MQEGSECVDRQGESVVNWNPISRKGTECMIDTILFDLDGTLLPMDQDKFMHAYLGGLSAKMAPYGYEPKALIKALLDGTMAMYQNDGRRTNEELFWDVFADELGPGIRNYGDVLENFYRNEFQQVRHSCGFDPDAAKAIAALKDMGLRVVLATNPLFPASASESRIRWGGWSRRISSCTPPTNTAATASPIPPIFRRSWTSWGWSPGSA